MKLGATMAGVGLGALLLGGGFVVVVHGDWLKPGAKGEEDEVHVETEVPVHVAKVARTTLHRYVDAFGTVVPEPAHDGKTAAGAKLASPVAGVLTQALCSEGQHVEKGATLFQLDPRAAAAEEQKAAAAKGSASATLERLISTLEYERKEVERTRKLHDAGLASDKDVHDAELRFDTAKSELAEARAKVAEADKTLAATTTGRALLAIKAPLSGTVVRVLVNPGEAVDTNPATVIAEIVDLDRLVVEATIPAHELPDLKLGQPVDLFPARPKDAADDKPQEVEPVHGTLSFLGFSVDTKTDTLPVRISFPKEAGFKPGQYLRLRIVTEERKDVLAVPVESLVRADDATSVAVVENDVASLVTVTAGAREAKLVEVSGEGLKEGATVVTAGSYGLPKKTKVRVIGE